MKIFIWLSFVAMSFINLNAQNENGKNAIVIGGNMNILAQNNTFPFSSNNRVSGNGVLYSNSTNDSNRLGLAFAPYIGKEINASWLLGISLDIEFSKTVTKDALYFNQLNSVDVKFPGKGIGGGIFARYTFNPQNALNFYVQPYVEYDYLSEKSFQDEIVTERKRTNYVDIGLKGGMLYNINEKYLNLFFLS